VEFKKDLKLDILDIMVLVNYIVNNTELEEYQYDIKIFHLPYHTP